MSEHKHTPERHEQPDAWHQHTADEGLPQTEHGARANPVALTVTLFAIVFSFVFLLLVVWLYYNTYSTQLKAERREVVSDTLRTDYATKRGGAQTRLTQSPGWIDRINGKVHIPLDRAASLVIEEYSQAGAMAPATTEVARDDG
ncbi:MAG: hypothetical protein RIB32_02175 [Phycisphaerales bacterium]